MRFCFIFPGAMIFFSLLGFVGHLPLAFLKSCKNSEKNTRTIYPGSPSSLFQIASDPMPSEVNRMMPFD